MRTGTAILAKCKAGIEKELARQNINGALDLIHMAARMLYVENQYLVDEELESRLRQIAERLDPIHQTQFEPDVVLFYDGFGYNSRGLAQIYLKALTKVKRVVYVCDEQAKDRIPDLLQILSGHTVVFLKEKDHIGRIREIAACMERYEVSSFFFYSFPEDVDGEVILYAYRGKRLLINLTDDAFWLGAGAIDTCIEYRDIGANISRHGRGFGASVNIVKVPMYPIIDRERAFQGFPFPAEGKKVVFSGGGLYKTFGQGNLYYRMVDDLLSAHEEVIFWYAGEGDSSELDKIIRKYPGRAFHTHEREDLFQVLRHCCFYLSTYPICGGLMIQYAAEAGKVPLTLRFEHDPDGLLINQEQLGVVFDSYEDMKKEIDRLLNIPGYREEKGKQMEGAVISEEVFNRTVEKLLAENETGFPIADARPDMSGFRKMYLENISEGEYNRIIAREGGAAGLRLFPVRYMLGEADRVVKAIRKRIH